MRTARGGRWRRTFRPDHKTGSNAALRSRSNRRSTEVALDFYLSLPHPRGMAKDNKVIAANAAFYAAFSTGDFAGMEFRQIIQHEPCIAEVIVAEEHASGDDDRDVRLRRRSQPVGGILDRDALRRLQFQSRQHFEIDIRRRLLMPHIVAGDDRIE